MKLTDAFKQWLRENKSVAEDATDDDYRKAAAEALADGTLDHEKFIELTSDPDAEKASSFESKLSAIIDTVNQVQVSNQKQVEALAAKVDKMLEQPKQEVKAPKLPEQLTEAIAKSDGPAETDPEVQVKHITPDMKYDNTKSLKRYPEMTMAGKRHTMAGQVVEEAGRPISDPSELDKAVCGATFKYMLQGTPGLPHQLRITDHDKELFQYALANYNWGGSIHGVGDEFDGATGVKNRRLTPREQKAVLDESGVSQGLEIVPIVFDDAIITTPLLHGELYPKVNVVNITRGRRIEGASISNPTIASSDNESTTIPLQTTASFISAFDTNIHVAHGSIELGLDFLSDSPVDVASVVAARYGQQMLKWLDDQIANGDGTTEPTGLTNTTPGTVVTCDNTTTGPPTVGDYEDLLFGVAKEYKQGYDKSRCCFVGTETSYQRSRGIAVGAADQRRVFGMSHEDYMLFKHPYAINAMDGTHNYIAFCNLARYRMYRRLGLTVKATTEGKTLVRSNYMLLSVRARFGGQLEDSGALALTTAAMN